jgi:hypothetical protein
MTDYDDLRRRSEHFRAQLRLAGASAALIQALRRYREAVRDCDIIEATPKGLEHLALMGQVFDASEKAFDDCTRFLLSQYPK